MKLNVENRYAASVEQAYTTHVTESVREEACRQSGAKSWKVEITRSADGGAIVQVERTMSPQLPDYIAKLIGGSVTIRQVEEWSPAAADGSRTATVKLTIVGQPASMTGRAELTLFLRNNFHNPRHVTAELVERLYANSRQKGAIHPYASLITGYLDCHLLSSLPKVPNPILLVWGRQARPTPVEHSVRLLAMARDSHLEVVEDAGAWVHYEQSAIVNRLIVRYLNGEIATSRSAATATPA